MDSWVDDSSIAVTHTHTGFTNVIKKSTATKDTSIE